MFLKHLEDQIRLLVTVCRYSSVVPIHRTQNGKVWRTNASKTRSAIVVGMTVAYAAAVAYNTWNTPLKSKLDKASLGFWSYVGFVWTGLSLLVSLEGSQVAVMLNSFSQYEALQQNRFGSRKISQDSLLLLAKVLLRILIYTGALLVPAIVLGSTVFPDTPPFVNSWYWVEYDSPGPLYTTLACKVGEVIVWYSLIYGAVFAGFCVITIGTSILFYVNNLKYMASSIILEEKIQEYKMLQLLMQLYNSIMAKYLSPFVLFMTMFTTISSGSLAIKNARFMTTQPLLLIMPIIALDASLFILGWGFVGGKIHDSSNLQLEHYKGYLAGQTRRGMQLLRRRLRELTPLKVKFGSNFMEMSTSLVMINFVTNCIVQWLLIDQRGPGHNSSLQKK